MERSLQKHALVNLLALLAAGAAAFAAGRYSNSLAGQVAAAHLVLSAFIALVCWFQIRLEEREQLEKLDLDDLARGRGGASLFENKDAEVFPARRAREQFEKYFVPSITVLLMLLQGAGAFFFWKIARAGAVTPVSNPMGVLPVFGLLFLLLFLLGRFAVAFARREGGRLLRPTAGGLLLGAYVCLAVAAGVGAAHFEHPDVDGYVAMALAILLGVISVETLFSLVLEIYRPRVKGRVARPVYESRAVGLLSQPESVFSAAAQTLDYQFGFKVSETWFYRFLRERFVLLVFIQLLVLLLSTCVVFIDPGEQALLERWGRHVAVLDPGAHLKLPWPIDQAIRHRTDQIQSFVVGMVKDKEEQMARATLWTVAHGQEDNFLVASRDLGQETTDKEGVKRAPPVSLLTVSIPIQFQITNILDWAYQNEDPAGLLKRLATREVVKYLVNVDIAEFMSRGRSEAGQTLRARIQTAANEQKLGVGILFVGLEGTHPPIKVASEYEAVVSAKQKMQATILAARADAIRADYESQWQSAKLLNLAQAEQYRRKSVTEAQAARFTNQIASLKAAPTVYGIRTYLQTVTRATEGVRKYVILATNTHDVVQLDLQDKLRESDLDSVKIPPPK
jgi:regulator of protease activity HflC (stomatin/prohibitin superfamily)